LKLSRRNDLRIVSPFRISACLQTEHLMYCQNFVDSVSKEQVF